MKVMFPKVTTLSHTYLDKTYTANFWGGIVADNAWHSTALQPPPVLIIDDPNFPNGKYLAGSKWDIPELAMKYIAKVDTSTYPPASSDWEREPMVHMAHRDEMPTTQGYTLRTDAGYPESAKDYVAILDMSYADTIVFQNINNAKEASLYRVDQALPNGIDTPNGELVMTVDMSQDLEFDCLDCCSPEPVEKEDGYFMLTGAVACTTDTLYKLVIKSSGDWVRIGTIAVGRSMDFGCMLKGTRLKLDKNIKFQQTKINRNIDIIRWGTTIEIEGSVLMDVKNKEKIFRKTSRHNNFVFGITDEFDNVENQFVDVVQGELNLGDWEYSTQEKVEVKLNIKGVLA